MHEKVVEKEVQAVKAFSKMLALELDKIMALIFYKQNPSSNGSKEDVMKKRKDIDSAV